jgi:hypothetical protein
MTKTETKQKQFRTENMKTTMKQLAAVSFIALILMVNNVNAEGKQANASGYVNNETSLQIEKWMIDSETWNVKANTIDFIDQPEQELSVETWMVTNWEMQNLIEEETESEVNVENWMTSETVWNVNDFRAENEASLEIENWMLCSKVWNN